MKLYRWSYSPYARKVQAVLDLTGARYEAIEVPYQNRDEIATVTGGHVMVPVLVEDTGEVVVESRVICERLVSRGAGVRLVPSPLEGPVWAYHDFADGPLEDVLFRIASPAVRDAWATPGERALYTFIKERRFGAGCVDAWLRERDALFHRAEHLLAPSRSTLGKQPFLFGAEPTLADAALYGNLVMIREASPALLDRLGADLASFTARLEVFRFAV